MAKITSISSDLDFIKEFEELKLKQKLLIDSLNKKNGSQQNQLFLEINSKLDFLVKIFKDANDTDSKAEEEKLQIHFKEVLDKIDLVQKSFDEKFTKLEENNKSINNNLELFKDKVNSILVTSSSQSILSNNSIPVPTPNFQINTLDIKSAVNPTSSLNVVVPTPVVEEKKKGWFK